MSIEDESKVAEIRKTIASVIGAHWKLFLLQGVILAILGIFAIAMPLLSTLAVEILIGWLFLIGGVLRTVTLLRAQHMPGYWWSLAAAIVAIVLGVVLIAKPFQGVLTLTVVLMALFLIEGLSALFTALDFRHHLKNWGWLLFSGLIDFVLVFLIWQGWPGSAAWAIGLLTGVNLFFLGLSLVMLALSARGHKSPA